MKTVENYCSAFFFSVFDPNINIPDCTAVVFSIKGNTTATSRTWGLSVRFSQVYRPPHCIYVCFDRRHVKVSYLLIIASLSLLSKDSAVENYRGQSVNK